MVPRAAIEEKALLCLHEWGNGIPASTHSSCVIDINVGGIKVKRVQIIALFLFTFCFYFLANIIHNYGRIEHLHAE